MGIDTTEIFVTAVAETAIVKTETPDGLVHDLQFFAADGTLLAQYRLDPKNILRRVDDRQGQRDWLARQAGKTLKLER